MTVDQRVAQAARPRVVALRLRREVLATAAVWRIPGVRQGTLGSALIAAGSLTPAFLPKVNPFTHLPLLGQLQSGPGRFLATALLMAGVLLLLDGWLRLRPGAGRPGPVRQILWLWSAPLLLAPPLFSRDAYSYAAQGRLVDIGLDPYRYGPIWVVESYSRNVDPMWLFTSSPYGPLALQIQHLIVAIAGPHPYAAAVAMRLPALLGVALLAVLLPRLGCRLGHDVPMTTWLAVLNPLVVMHLVGGSHNDAPTIGLMVLGVWLAVERRPWLAVIAVAAAASIKVPGVLALLAVVALEARRRKGAAPSVREAIAVAAPLGGLCMAAFVAITAASGLGFGWVGSLWVPSAVRSVLSPPTAAGIGLERVLMWLHVPGAMDTTVPVVQVVAMLAGLVLSARVALRLGPVNPVRALAMVVVILVLTGPVVHPWYALWGGLLYAMTEGGHARRRRVVVWTTAGLVVYSAVDSAFRNGALALGVTAALALAWLVSGHDRNLDRVHDRERDQKTVTYAASAVARAATSHGASVPRWATPPSSTQPRAVLPGKPEQTSPTSRGQPTGLSHSGRPGPLHRPDPHQ